jgi:hypothetical protein
MARKPKKSSAQDEDEVSEEDLEDELLLPEWEAAISPARAPCP